MVMGITKLPDLYNYWSTSDTLHYFPVASRIPRKRFLEIQRYLHFSDNKSFVPQGQEGHDHLAKVRLPHNIILLTPSVMSVSEIQYLL